VIEGLDFAHVRAAALAGFIASSVECVEALTVALAIALVRGWQGALVGSLSGLILLSLAARTLVSSLMSILLSATHLVVGALLPLFGLRWLRTAILRAAGAITLHDQAPPYAKEVTALRALKGGSAVSTVSRRRER
jgi:uncharacterized membrane protein